MSARDALRAAVNGTPPDPVALLAKPRHYNQGDHRHYNQDQDQDQDQVNSDVEKQIHSVPRPPGPGCKQDTAERRYEDTPALRHLEDAYRKGTLHPIDVQLGAIPNDAGPVMRGIAGHMRLRIGLRAAVGDSRPLPYALSEAVNAGLAADKAVASRAISALVHAGVIDHVGQLPPLRPGLDGTKLYAPPPAERPDGGLDDALPAPTCRCDRPDVAEDEDGARRCSKCGRTA